MNKENFFANMERGKKDLTLDYSQTDVFNEVGN